MNLFTWLRGYTLDIDAVARALVEDVLEEFAPSELEPNAARQFLRTRYMRLVAKYGLPPAACDAVADRGWALIRRAQTGPAVQEQPFSFYG